MRTKGKEKLKIIAACSVAIFSLLTVLGGAYSWFTLQMTANASTTEFAVVNIGSCDLYSIELIKFDYHVSTYGSGPSAFTVIDYLTPETGTVNNYSYNKTLKQFGYNDGTWHQVSKMNIYDPVDLIIFNREVKEINTNSIFKFTITSDDLTDVILNASVAKILDAVKQESEIFLSTCTDFDIFFESDLDDNNPAFGVDHKAFYPSYIGTSETMTAIEDTYYKISYLAYLNELTHAHFYGGSANEVSLISNKSTSFTYDSTLGKNAITLYVNVNYASSQLQDTMNKIYQSNIEAICDFGFKFFFEDASV